MNAIKGIEILNQTINYTANSFILIPLIILIIGVILFIVGLQETNGPSLITGIFMTIIGIAGLGMTTSDSNNFLTKPSSIDYTVEIIDENSWKEIGPRFQVIERVYDNKEIYIIRENLTSDKN